MCPFCEGMLSMEAIECKYCGSSLLKKVNTSSEDSLASLYEPPYSPHRKSSTLGITKESLEQVHISEEKGAPTPIEEEKEGEETSQIGALLLLSMGSQLFTLAWLLYFFSDGGKLTLEWQSKYWFFYALFALPLLYQGWKKLKKVE